MPGSQQPKLSRKQLAFKKAVEFKGYTFVSATYKGPLYKGWRLLFSVPLYNKTYYLQASTDIDMFHKIAGLRVA